MELKNNGEGGSNAEELKNNPDNGSGGAGEKASGDEQPKGQESQKNQNEMVSLDEHNKVKNLAQKASDALKKAEDSIVKYKKIAEKAIKDGYLPEADTEDIEARIMAKVEEKLSSLKPKEDDDVSSLRRVNEELIYALKAKNTISNSSRGNNQVKIEPEKAPQFTEQELNILRRRGIDPKKVKNEIKVY